MSSRFQTLPELTCPACDYERGEAGRPELDGDHARCLDCGTTWREFDNGVSRSAPSNQFSRSPAARGPTPPKPFGKIVRDEEYDKYSEEKSGGYAIMGHNRSPLWLAGIAGLGLLCCLGASIILLQSIAGPGIDRMITASIPQGEISVGDIKLDEKVRFDGKKIFTVSGSLSNRSGKARPVRRLAIQLQDEAGKELFRWFYNSPVPVLENGRSLKFVTSVQYDTPFPVYAKAQFQ